MKLFKDERAEGELIAVVAVLAVIVILATIMLGYPQYKVYKSEMNGKAELAEAEWSKKIAVEAAKADRECAELEKDAMIIRAEGVAEANEIVSGSLDPMYINYLIAKGLTDGSSEVIYVPTEASIPTIDAGRIVSDTIEANA